MDNMRVRKSHKNNDGTRVGTPYDIDRCFFIKDFRGGDTIRVKINGVVTRGVVKDIDLDTMEVIFQTADSSDNRTVLNNIISLEEYQKDWLNNS